MFAFRMCRRAVGMFACHRSASKTLVLSTTPVAVTRVPNLQVPCRYKHRDSKKGGRSARDTAANQDDDDYDEEEQQTDEWETALADKQTKLLTVRVGSLRADLVLKAGLGIARNKVETLFYDSKIHVNGQKLMKKATMLQVGDEVDVVRGVSPTNPDFLTVSRLEILSVNEKGDNLSVKLRRNKALTVDKYPTENDK